MTATLVSGDIELSDMIEMSEPGNALRLVYLAKGRIHFVEKWNCWIVYNDGKWDRDHNGVGLQELAKMVPQSLFIMADAMKKAGQDVEWCELHTTWGRKSNTEPQLKRMINLARGLPGIRIEHDELDAHPWLFNMENGTFDFWSNQFRDHDPSDLLTVKANAMYDPDANCPAWLGYLDQWMPDRSVQRFLGEITGSGLTGIAVQNLFVNVGAGRNGKGTFYKTIQTILGDYAVTASEDMLIETHFKAHDEEKAKLRGCRFLVAPETGIGDRLDEAGIKNMTGGDVMHARHLYGRPFDFMPSHTVFLHTNHNPGIRGTDAGIWSRVMKIMWLYTVPFEERDMHIDDKLKAERSGILNWLIDGAKRFRNTGIRPPKTVMDWTEEYRQAEDKISLFLADTLDAMGAEASSLGAVDYIAASTLRSHYEKWCEREGMKPWSAQAVSKELRRLGWEDRKQRIAPSGPCQVIKVWFQNQETGISGTPAQTTDSTLLFPVSSISILNPITEREEEEVNEEVSIGVKETRNTDESDDWEPSEEDHERRHREWLYDHGYPVPPTDFEIERDQAMREYEEPQ